MPPRLSKNRRAHFPVGGKRNTLNFFGHGNRPKKKGKTAAEDDEEDDRPRRKAKTSHQWAILAAVGALGAGATYWAFQNPGKVRDAAKTLGVDNAGPVRAALDFISGGTPEDRLAREKQLQQAAEAEHGHAAKSPTAMDPTGLTPARKLNDQEAKIVESLTAAGKIDEAKFLTDNLTRLPDAGALTIQHPSKDPEELASQLLGTRRQYDIFRAQVENKATMEGVHAGLSPAEIQQHRAQAVPRAREMHEQWAKNPASWSQSFSPVLPGAAQGYGSAEIQAAQVEHSGMQLRAAGDRGLTGRSSEIRDALANSPAFDKDPDQAGKYRLAGVADALATAKEYPDSPWGQKLGALAAQIQPNQDDVAKANYKLDQINRERQVSGLPPLDPTSRNAALHKLIAAPAAMRFAAEQFKGPDQGKGLLTTIQNTEDQSVMTALLDPRIAAQAPLFAETHRALKDVIERTGTPPEKFAELLHGDPSLQALVNHAKDTHDMTRRGFAAAQAGADNVAAQQTLAAQSHPATSWRAAIAELMDPVLNAVTPTLALMNMAAMGAGYTADSRGAFNPMGGKDSELIRQPEAAVGAGRARSVLDQVKAEEAALKRGDIAEVQRIRRQPLASSPETVSDVEARNASAARYGHVGHAAERLGTQAVLRTMAPMGWIPAALMGGGLGSTFTLLRADNTFSKETMGEVAKGLGHAGTFAAQVAAAKSKLPVTMGPHPAQSWISRYGFSTQGVKALGQQAKWVGSLGTAEEATKALARVGVNAVASPRLAALARVNVIRGAPGFALSSAQYGTIATGGDALIDVAGHAVNAIKGEMHDKAYQDDYINSYRGVASTNGRPEDIWGTGSATGQARDVGGTVWNAVTADFQGIKERQAGATGYFRMLREGASPGMWSGIAASMTGVNDPDKGFWRISAAVRGARDAMFDSTELKMREQANEIATKIVEGNPMWANSSIKDRAGMVKTIADTIAGQHMAQLKESSTIVQVDTDNVIKGFQDHAKAFRMNSHAVTERSGAALAGEADRLMEHFLPKGNAVNDSLHSAFNNLGVNNAAVNQGIDIDRLIRTGRVEGLPEVAARYAQDHMDKLGQLPGGVGKAYTEIHDKVYGATRRRVERALGAPEMKYVSPERKTAIMEAALGNIEKQFAPAFDKWTAANPKADLADFAKSPGGTAGAAGESSPLKMFQQAAGIHEAPRTQLNTGSAEAANSASMNELAALVPAEAHQLLDPVAIHAEANQNSGMDYEQRNNNKALGLFTKGSEQGQQAQQRDANWVKDMEASGFKMPDQPGFERLLSSAVRSGTDLPTRYIGPDQDSTKARRGAVEVGDDGLVVRQQPNANRPTYEPGTMIAVMRTLANQNPELLREVSKGASVVPTMLAQERPWLEKALAAPGGGFTKMGPNGQPGGTASTWEELRADMTANPRNYAKAWRPEVQKYLAAHEQYQTQRMAAAPTGTPEVIAELQPHGAYHKFYSQEQAAWAQAGQPKPEPPRTDPLGRLVDTVNPFRGLSTPRVSPDPRGAFKPSMTEAEFETSFRADPMKYKQLLSPKTQEYHQANQAWEQQQKTLRAPAGPGAAPKYTPPPKPAVVSPAPAPVPAATPTTSGPPAKP